MKFSLKSLAKATEWQKTVVELQERLPKHLLSPCTLTCDFRVSFQDNYYLLSMRAKGEVSVCCQRCLQIFSYPYENETELAICASDEMAQRLMEKEMECIVIADDQVNLKEILIDELHLYTPERHTSLDECDQENVKFIE